MDNIITVIVCTYNRADLLINCLSSLERQSLNKNLYEVLIIDNNSTDETKKIVEIFTKKNNNFKYLFESTPGKSFASNSGWKNAKGKYIAFLDDDARALKDWLEMLYLFSINNQDINVFGGPYTRFSIKNLPNWFPPEYGILNLGNENRIINIGKEWITGTNMVFKKELLKKFNGFSTELGPMGEKMSYGEETNLLSRINKEGIPIYYVHNMLVEHLVADYKMNLKWLLKSSYLNGVSSILTFDNNRNIYLHIAALFKSLIIGVLYLLKPVNIPFKRRLYYSLNNLTYQTGAITNFFKQYFQH